MSFSKLKNELINQNSFFDEIFKDSSIKFFLNLKEITDENIPINDGDEIALLPPVTGG
jgi:molybdopterin converting factor small subunit